MNHRPSHFHAGGPSIGKDPSGFSLEQGQYPGGGCLIFGVEVDGGRQLPLQPSNRSRHRVYILAADHH